MNQTYQTGPNGEKLIGFHYPLKNFAAGEYAGMPMSASIFGVVSPNGTIHWQDPPTKESMRAFQRWIRKHGKETFIYLGNEHPTLVMKACKLRRHTITVQRLEVKINPSLEVYTVEITDGMADWRESFATLELLLAFLRGLRVATMMAGQQMLINKVWQFSENSIIKQLP